MHRARQKLLRSGTAGVHKELEAVVDAAGYFANRSAYGRYIQRLHRLHVALSAMLADRAEALVPGFRLESRTHWLSLDLAAMALPPLPAAGSVHRRLLAIEDRDRLLGCLYVILGATLGARVLTRSAEELGYRVGTGATYLSQTARATTWVEFLDRLENEPSLSDDRLLEGAMATFETFKHHLAEAVPA